MITKLLLEEITQESIESGQVVTERDGNIAAISTNKGTLGIREEESNTFYITYLPANLVAKDDVFDGNKRMMNWYTDFTKNRKCEKKYVQMALFNQTLNFVEAYELSEYILSKIIKNEHKAHKILN